MARGWLRHLVERAFGAPGRTALAWRTRGQAEALLRTRGLSEPAAELSTALEDRVQRGPFAGMHYPRRRGDIVQSAKLVGTYESELHGAIEELLARLPSGAINVGSGDGYYAVGLARRIGGPGIPLQEGQGPSYRVVAVDPDPLAQRACGELAELNGVASRLRRMARIDHAGLSAILDPLYHAQEVLAPEPFPNALLVVDCEGCEDELLDPDRVLGLRVCHLLVETHDFARPGVTARLTERFAATHHVRRIDIAARDAGTVPELSHFPAAVAAGLLDEFRHSPQSWLVLTAGSPRA